MIKTLVIALVLGGMSIALAACNTTKGAGEDMQSAGQSIHNSAVNHGAQP
ncbi:MAG TPA: entericidin A/B family lipoprotein [Phycisphaerae bacterium]|nr:entericidin A/B family lipoprotein [Phycisphaerae bacterium]